MKPKRKTMKWKSSKAWALADPETGYIDPHYVYKKRMSNGGRGSITEGWKCIRVLITPITK